VVVGGRVGSAEHLFTADLRAVLPSARGVIGLRRSTGCHTKPLVVGRARRRRASKRHHAGSQAAVAAGTAQYRDQRGWH
jgi:hypothetical protein